MKKLAIASILGATVLLAVTLGMVALAPAMADTTKVTICHYDPEADTFETLHVGSQSAADRHVANHQYDTDGDGSADTGDDYGECT